MSKAFQKLIYLASPYSHKDNNVVTKRVLEVQDATARLIEQGHLIFSPIVHSHFIATQVSFEPVHDENSDLHNGTTWLDYDRAMIDKADELWILRLPGHTISKGVHAELYHALDRGIPVKYINYPDLSVFADVGITTVACDGLPEEWPDAPTKEDYGKINTWGKPFPDRNGVRAWMNGVPVEAKREDGVISVDVPEDVNIPLIQGDYNSEVQDVFGPPLREISATVHLPLTDLACNYFKDKVAQLPTIIGLTGHAQSGKDTVGKYLVENRGFTRVGLADAVKDCLYALDPFVDVDILSKAYVSLTDKNGFCISQSRSTADTDWVSVQNLVDNNDWETAKQIPRVREFLQRIGTEVGRNIISPTVWLNIAERKIKELGPAARVVITDIRFPNEAEWVRALGGQVVRINREGFGPVNDHASDQKLDYEHVDVELYNNRDFDFDYLYDQIETKVIPYV